MQRPARALRAAMAVLLLPGVVAGCGTPPRPELLTGVPKPARSTATVASPALPGGRESVYTLVNTGTWKEADDLLDDRWDVPRFEPVVLPGGPTWRENPYNDQYWRFYFYGLRPLSNLLWAYYTSGQVRYRDKLIQLLRSFTAFDATQLTTDPTGLDDPHALAFRSMILINSYAKLKRSGDLPDDLAAAMRGAIGRSASKLELPQNYQGTYNHGFTQAAALLLVHANFPDLDPNGRFGALASARLAQLLTGTIDDDGVEIEKSPFYHFYVLDFLLELQDWANRNQIALPPGTAQRIESMVRYSTQVIWPNGAIPTLGSSVQLRPERSAALYAALLEKHPEFAFAISGGTTGRAPAERAILFGRTGQAVLRSAPDPAGRYADNSQLILDFGVPITDHSHLEALGFNYYSHGRELLPDSGLNTYVGGDAYDYFHGTTAHNTVVIDGRIQGSGPITAGLTTTGLTTGGDGWAYQSGRSQAYPGVQHRRSVLLLTRDLVLVVDDLSSPQRHGYEQLWHLFPGAHLAVEGTVADAHDEYDNPALTITQASVGSAPTVRTYYGNTKPMQGWYSAEYGRAEPNHVVGYAVDGTAVRYVTLLASGPYAAAPATVTASGDSRALRVDVCVTGYAAGVAIDNQAEAGERVAVEKRPECAHGN